MPVTRWSEKFYESTRGRIVGLLRQGSATVDQLAKALGLTDNAVRSHLATLERDGIIEQSVSKRDGTVGKPAYRYALAPDAEPLFSRAYVPLLVQLLQVLAERIPQPELDAMMRTVGRRLAADQSAPRGTMWERAEAAVHVLNALGGIARVEEHDDQLAIRGASCPLGAAVHGHPEVCRAVEALLAELVGAPVHERCERGEHGERARCCFEIDAPQRT
jgi:predicted ArsR family transcriptional regulator